MEQIQYPNGGGIGANSPGFSQWMLDNSEEIRMDVLELQGYSTHVAKNGKLEMVKLETTTPYSEKVISFYAGKIKEVLSKNTFLSNLSDEEQMYREMQIIGIQFTYELHVNSKEFELTPEQLVKLSGKFDNRMSFALRRALNEGEKRFLQRTVSESTQNIKQDINEQQQKRSGGFLGLFGGK